MRQVDEQKSGTALVSLAPVVAMAGMITSAASIAARVSKVLPLQQMQGYIRCPEDKIRRLVYRCLQQTGEKCLSKCEDPGGRLCQNFRLHAEDIAVSGSSSRLKGNIDAKDHKQYKEDRHHHFIGLFDAASNAVHQDKHADHKSSQLPEIISQAEAMPPNLAPKDSISAGARVDPVKVPSIYRKIHPITTV